MIINERKGLFYVVLNFAKKGNNKNEKILNIIIITKTLEKDNGG